MTKKPKIVSQEVKLAHVEQILLKKMTIQEVSEVLNVRKGTV